MTPPTLLLPQILTKAQKRVYPSYNYTRTLSLFPSRAALLAYEKALLLETEVDDALGEQETLNGRRPFSKNGEGKAAFGSGLGRREGAEVVRAIWELVWDRWRTVVAQAQKEGMEREGARTVSDRFQPGASSPARFPDRSAVGISTTDYVLPRRLPARRPRPDPNRLQGRVRARRPARLQRRVRRPACATRPESLAAR
jgi:hypothetical protein